MFSLSRTVLRWGLIGAVGTGGVVYLIGTERVWAAVDQARSSAREFTDDLVDDPVALRRQLRNLAARYPERIAEVAGELAEIAQQRAQLSHDAEVARRVVALTNQDLNELRLAVAETDARPFESRIVSIRVSGRVVALDEAREEARRIATIRATYQDRLVGDEMQREFLATQHDRLSDILDKLESEHTRYETKLWQLDRQIDAIARNDRLIDMTKEQQALLSEYDKFGDVGSLDQLEAKLAELRTIQEAQLQTLAKRGVRSDYEDRARSGLDLESYDPLFDPPAREEPTHNGDIAAR